MATIPIKAYPIEPGDRFGCCNVCQHHGDDLMCDECDAADNFEIDEEVLEEEFA